MSATNNVPSDVPSGKSSPITCLTFSAIFTSISVYGILNGIKDGYNNDGITSITLIMSTCLIPTMAPKSQDPFQDADNDLDLVNTIPVGFLQANSTVVGSLHENIRNGHLAMINIENNMMNLKLEGRM